MNKQATPAHNLPTEDEAVIIPADGREYIEAKVWGKTYHAREAIRLGQAGWLGAWRSNTGMVSYAAPEEIDPDTWKVDGK